MYLGTRDGRKTELQHGDRMTWDPNNGTVMFFRDSENRELWFCIDALRQDEKRPFPRGKKMLPVVRQFANVLADMHGLQISEVTDDRDGTKHFRFITSRDVPRER